MRESPYPEIPYDEALAAVLAVVRSLAPARLPIEAAHGLVLAEALLAAEPMPPFAAAAKDGYAVRSADGAGPHRLAGAVTAGQPLMAAGVMLAPGTAVRITTGAAVPDGADAVAMVEEVDEVEWEGAPAIQLRRPVAAHEHVRPVGEDFPAGAVLLEAGTRLGAAELGLAAGAGSGSVAVYPRPRVAIFSTGDELVAPGASAAPGQIRDSNRFTLAAAAREAGAEVGTAGTLRDRAEDVARLAEAIRTHDAVVTSGGVSMGERDLIKPWLAEHGRIVFGRVRIKPGKPMTLAVVDGTPVFALPGFPVSSLVCFELFVRPALRRLAGITNVARPVWPVRLEHRVAHALDRTEFVRAQVRMGADGTPIAASTGAQGSGRLLSMAGANALLRMPEGGQGWVGDGEVVQAVVVGEVY